MARCRAFQLIADLVSILIFDWLWFDLTINGDSKSDGKWPFKQSMWSEYRDLHLHSFSILRCRSFRSNCPIIIVIRSVIKRCQAASGPRYSGFFSDQSIVCPQAEKKKGEGGGNQMLLASLKRNHISLMKERRGGGHHRSAFISSNAIWNRVVSDVNAIKHWDGTIENFMDFFYLVGIFREICIVSVCLLIINIYTYINNYWLLFAYRDLACAFKLT